jgi:predicted nucleotidyltransferase
MRRRLDDIPLSARDRAAIEEAARALKAAFPVESVILFGSKARGDDDVESDIDLLVLTTQKLSWQERDTVRSLLSPIEMSHSVVLSTLVVPAEEWRDGVISVLPIHTEVESQGVAA